MSQLDILGIKRESRFSPNHIGNDDAIFCLTTQELEKKGCRITICTEDEFLIQENTPQDFIFTMAREKAVVAKLQLLESGGKKVINSGYGIENCFRTNMTNLLINNAIPYPKSYVVSTSAPQEDVFEKLNSKGFWIKRGDFHAIHSEDVTFVESAEQGFYILKEFYRRNIYDAVVSAHLLGDLVKFYGVRDSDFFHIFYPYDYNHHKYADYERINGKTSHYRFNEDALKQAALKSAQTLNIHIYGGDAIIDKNGDFQIIDLNDWPSFAPCKEKAFPYIAGCILDYFTK